VASLIVIILWHAVRDWMQLQRILPLNHISDAGTRHVTGRGASHHSHEKTLLRRPTYCSAAAARSLSCGDRWCGYCTSERGKTQESGITVKTFAKWFCWKVQIILPFPAALIRSPATQTPGPKGKLLCVACWSSKSWSRQGPILPAMRRTNAECRPDHHTRRSALLPSADLTTTQDEAHYCRVPPRFFQERRQHHTTQRSAAIKETDLAWPPHQSPTWAAVKFKKRLRWNSSTKHPLIRLFAITNRK
jgi:hypothetical protein